MSVVGIVLTSSSSCLSVLHGFASRDLGRIELLRGLPASPSAIWARGFTPAFARSATQRDAGAGTQLLLELAAISASSCRSRAACCGRGQRRLLLPAVATSRHVGEEGGQTVEILLRERVVLVVVALAQPMVEPSQAAAMFRTRSAAYLAVYSLACAPPSSVVCSRRL